MFQHKQTTREGKLVEQKKMVEQKRRYDQKTTSTGKGHEIPGSIIPSSSPRFDPGASSSSAAGWSGRIVSESPLLPGPSNFYTPVFAPSQLTSADVHTQEISACRPREVWRIKICVIYTSSNVQTVRVEGSYEDMQSANDVAISRYWAEWFGHRNIEPLLGMLFESQRLTEPYQMLGRTTNGARHISCCVYKDEEGAGDVFFAG
ncbi:MAG: hypothetical protein Q9174_006518 [Haloplaca sp. 1 TL-2023]